MERFRHLRLARATRAKESLLVCLVFASILLINSCSPGPVLSPLARDSVILAFGDSLTYGTGVQSENAYPSVLQKLTGLRVVNAGVPGEISSEGLTRLPEQLDKYRPDLVIICHGGNDILRKLSFAEAEKNLRKMVELSQNHGVQVVLINVPKFGIWKSSPEYYARIAKDLSIPLEQSILPELEFDAAMKSDPIHLNETGYRKFAEAIASLLKKHGALRLNSGVVD